MLPFIQTDKGLSLILKGKMRTVSEAETDYAEVLEAVKAGKTDVDVLSILERNLRRVSEAVAALIEKKITDDVTISGGLVMYKGTEIHNTLADRMIKQLNEGFDLVPMARFLENLMQNPSYRAVQDLYSFLEYGQMPVTEDGCFMAYKAVNPNYTDIYTSSVDNSIGAKPWMPRNQVDENPDRPCRPGYHVCSFDYLPHFSHNNGHVMLCKVNPRDVVAIPRDYHQTKMRLNTYEVVGEYEGYYSAERMNVLAGVTVATEEEPFLVVVEGNQPETRRFARLSDAARVAEDAIKLDSTSRVEVKNGITDIVIESKDNPNFEGFPDDGEADLDEDEDPIYEVVYGDTEDDADLRGTPYESGISDLDHAKSVALKAHGEHPDCVIKVRKEGSVDSELTLFS